MNKTLVQHLHDFNDRMVADGFKDDDRCAYLCKIGTIIMHTDECAYEEVEDACKFIDEQILNSDEVPETAKMMLELTSLLVGL